MKFLKHFRKISNNLCCITLMVVVSIEKIIKMEISIPLIKDYTKKPIWSTNV